MDVLAGPYYAAALLVLGAGIVKLARPGEATRAVRAAGVAAPEAALRLLGAAEVAIAVVALGGGRAGAVALSATYAGFAAYVVVAAGRAATCGCFGAAHAPLGPVHLIANVVLAAVAAIAAVQPLPDPGAVLGAQPAAALPFAITVAAVTYLLYLAMTRFAELRHLVRR